MILGNHTSNVQLSNILKGLLNVHWLRPETALWRLIDILTMRSMGIKFKNQVLDFGCGDGLFTYIYSGGQIPEKFNIYKNVTGLNKFHKNFDVYNYHDHSDSIKIFLPIKKIIILQG